VGPGWQQERGRDASAGGRAVETGHVGRTGARRTGESWAENDPTEGCSFFFFYFLLLISISFISFSFEQIIS
jgi:hypothetical protein